MPINSVLTDVHPLGLLLAWRATQERLVYLIAQVVVEVEQRSRMARVEYSSQTGSNGKRVDELLAKRVVEDHDLLRRPSRTIVGKLYMIDRDDV